MNILIYLPNIHQGSGGVRQYSVTLIKMLKEINENHYFIYHDLNDKEIIDAIHEDKKFTLVTTEEINRHEFEIINAPVGKFKNIPILNKVSFKRRRLISGDLSNFCQKKSIQIVHCPYQYIPHVKNVKLITTLHDVQEIHFPQFFSAEQRAWRATNYLDFLRRTDLVMVSYDHIKKDLIKYFAVSDDKIKTLLLKMDKLWFDKYSNTDVLKLPFKLDDKKFLLYPANAWKHKNHLNLIEATAYLREKKNQEISIIFTGDFSGEHGKYIIKEISKLNLENQISILGIVEENVLFSLYKKCFATVIPTLYEAGSFPLMESILLDVPVVCSNITSLPETIGNSVFTFDPMNIFEIADKVNRIWNDSEFRNENFKQIKLQAKILKMNNPFPTLQKIYSDFNA